MKTLLTLLAALWLAAPMSVVADERSREQAEILLTVIDMKSVMEQSIEQMLDVQIQQNPAIGEYRDVMLAFFAKYMSYESIRPAMVTLYSDAFTADELREIIVFNRTPTGQKALELIPTLMREGAVLGAQRVQDNIGELQKMIEEKVAESQQGN